MPGEKIAAQADFSRGMFRGVARHLIPEAGCYDLLNYLLDDEDGTPYKRGGSANLSAQPAGVPDGSVGLWDGVTVAGERTLVAGRTLGPRSRVFVVSADDTTLTEFAPVSGVSVLELTDTAVKFSENGGVVAISGDYTDAYGANAAPYLYAGSRKTAGYTTGTASVAKGSRTVTGVGTSWSANADAGMFFRDGVKSVPVQSVDSNTQLTLAWPWPFDTIAASAYGLWPCATAGPSMVSNAEFVAGRVCAVYSGNPMRMLYTGFGELLQPTFVLPDYPASAEPTEWHDFPGRILGIHAIRDTALVFTTAGLFVVRNMAFDISDAAGNAQQTVEKLDGLVLWSTQGVQAWGNALVVPARDGVYLVDGLSRPLLLSRSVSELYRSYIQSGYRPGQAAILRDTYLLPLMDPASANSPPVAWLTCRLDAGEDGLWPHTRLSGAGMGCAAVRHRLGAQPKLLGGAKPNTKLALLSWFDPAASVKNDADGTAPTFTLETRDYPTGSGQKNTVREARVRGELVDAGSDNPTLAFAYAGEDGSYTTHPDAAAEGAEFVKSWLFSKRARYVRLKLTGTIAAATAAVRSIEVFARPSGRP